MKNKLSPSKLNRPMKPTKMNLSNNRKPLKTQMNQKKPTEVSEKELFTDLTFPTGFFAKLFKKIKMVPCLIQ